MLFLSSVCFTNINVIQHWLMAACSSSQVGLTAPLGTPGLCRDVCREVLPGTLFRHVLSQCISLAACTGRAIIVAKELFITVLPQQGSWGRMLVWALLFHVHTQLHTPQPCHYSTHAEHSSDISPGVYFPRRSLIQGEERMQLQPQSVHTSCKSLEASPQIATTSSCTLQDWQHG